MADKHILEQIDLLNPKLKTKKIDSFNNISITDASEASSSLSQISYNQLNLNNVLNTTISNSNKNNNNIFDNQVMINEEDNDVLNLWSSTNFFFDPLDTTEL
eukprot:jgi/Orpsp1_1/1189194/evm.model.d7180000070183.1